jgi:hypothetical protein
MAPLFDSYIWVTAQLRLRHAEQNYNNKFLSGDSFGLEAGRFWQDFLESAQTRFLRACESLPSKKAIS